MKFRNEDNGNVRVDYTSVRRLFCFQLDSGRNDDFSFLACSRDGEPSHKYPLANVGAIDLPSCETRVGQLLAKAMTSRDIWLATVARSNEAGA